MSRKRRKRTKGLGSMTIMCIITVAILNIVGISYGALSDSVNTSTSISTGKIDPYFCDKYEIKIVKNESNEELAVNLKDDNVKDIEGKCGNEQEKDLVANFENNHAENITDEFIKNPKGELTVNFKDAYTMNIAGKVKAGYKVFLNYTVKNRGTLPVKYDEEANKEKNKETNKKLQGLKFNLNQPSGIIRQEDSFVNNNENPKLEIEVNKNAEGIYNFEIELFFNQWH